MRSKKQKTFCDKLIFSRLWAFKLIVFVSISCTAKSGNHYCLTGEETVFGFETHRGKKVSVCTGREKKHEYLVYRFGTDSTVELQFPGDKRDSFKEFSFSNYFRGGGEENEGLDINYLSFENGGYYYTIFDEYSAADSSQNVGVKVENLKTGKIITIKGDPETIKGGLAVLRYDSRVRKE